MRKSALPPLVPLALLLTTAPTAAQIVGGGWDVRYQRHGLAANDSFGHAVTLLTDVDGDGQDDFAVGAYVADPGGMTDAGTVTVFSGASGAVIYRLDGAAAYDSFGETVNDVGDVDGDGAGDFLVGAPNADPGGRAEAGSVTLHSGASGGVLYQFHGTVPGQQFGKAVAGAGDVDADGVPDLILGMAKASPGGRSSAGSAFVFSGATGGLIYRRDGLLADDFFGCSVSGAGDVNADGFADFLVGAYGVEHGAMTDVGSAYLYSGASGALLHQFDGLVTDDWFGYSVAGAGNADGDGRTDLAVGAPGADVGGVRAGALYVYAGVSFSFLHVFDGPADYAGLGTAIARAGDVDGDGRDDLIAGMPLDSSGGAGITGSANVYSGADGAILHRFEGGAPADYFGNAVGGGRDVDGDGLGDLIVGAWLADPGALADAGSAYVYAGFEPYLTADAEEISVALGRVVNFALDFPTAAAGRPFHLLGSATGTGPSSFFGLEIPLTSGDLLWRAMLSSSPPSVFSAVSGTLDASGDAALVLTVPAGTAGSLIGRTLHFAAVVYAPPNVGLRSSVAVPLLFLP